MKIDEKLAKEIGLCSLPCFNQESSRKPSQILLNLNCLRLAVAARESEELVNNKEAFFRNFPPHFITLSIVTLLS